LLELPSDVTVHANCGAAGSLTMVTVQGEHEPLEQVLVGVPAAWVPHVVPSARGVTVHIEVPLHAEVLHPPSSVKHRTDVPTQPPLTSQASPYVHALASSHDVPTARLVTVHDAVPLHTRWVHALLVHVTLVPPPHEPALEHVSP